MVRIAVDFNRRDYEPGDIECEAIVRHGERWEWVADILDGTIRPLA